MIKYEISKSKPPILFIDTFAIINFFQNIKDSRYTELFDLLIDKTSKGHIICPLGNQNEEIYKNFSDVTNKFKQISKGFRFESHNEIEMMQYNDMFGNYRDLNDLVVINADIVLKINLNHSIDNIIDDILNDLNISKKTLSEYKEIIKVNNMNALNKFIKNNNKKPSYDEQLHEEFTGNYKSSESIIAYIKSKNDAGIPLSDIDALFIERILEIPLRNWEKCFKGQKGINDYLSFLKSEYNEYIPHIRIRSKLVADLITNGIEFNKSDPEDFHNTSSYLPYCDFFLTDLAQKNRICKLKIDSEFQTQVFCMANIKELIQIIQSL